jgi:hypothetical protein
MVMQEKTVATELEMVSWYLVELCLTEYSMVKFCPSQLAAAAVYTALNTLGKEATWGPALQRHSGYSESQLKYVCNAPLMPLFRLLFCQVLHCQSSLTSP